MLRYTLRFQPPVKEDVRRFSPEVKRLVHSTLDELSQNPRAGEPLLGELAGFWKYGAKRYRVIYEIVQEKREIIVWLINERRTVYQKMQIRVRSLP